jgi:hypothetical protein
MAAFFVFGCSVIDTLVAFSSFFGTVLGLFATLGDCPEFEDG